MAKKYKFQKYFTFRDKRYCVRADTEEELIIKMYKKKQELEGLVKTIDREMFVKDWAEEWLATYKEPSISDAALYLYKGHLKNHILPVIGSMRLKHVKPVHCQQILNKMHNKRKSKSTMEISAMLLKEMFSEAEANQLILVNPCKRLKIPEGTKQESRALTPYEETMVLQLADSHPFGIMVKLMLYCGLRIGEASALRWCDVDIKNSVLHIRHSLNAYTNQLKDPKTKAGIRDVPIPAVLLDDLKKLKSDPFDHVYHQGDHQFVVVHRRRLDWLSFKNDLNILMGCKADETGKALPPYRVAEDLRPHYFRHTYCTHLQEYGVPINVAKDLMGHSDIATTSKIYTHRSEQSFENARQLIEEGRNKKSAATPTATPTL